MKENEEPEFKLPRDTNLRKILDQRGIPVWRAEFEFPVNNTDDTPENYFSMKSAVKSRNVRMWWIIGDGLLCMDKGEYFIVPSSNVKFAKFE